VIGDNRGQLDKVTQKTRRVRNYLHGREAFELMTKEKEKGGRARRRTIFKVPRGKKLISYYSGWKSSVMCLPERIST